MGHGNAAGLLGVIEEVTLGKHIRIVADDLNRVLVGAKQCSLEPRPQNLQKWCAGVVSGFSVTGRDKWVTSSSMDRVNSGLGWGAAILLYTAIICAGTVSLDPKPKRPPYTGTSLKAEPFSAATTSRNSGSPKGRAPSFYLTRKCASPSPAGQPADAWR